jgi:hypothetical protein
MPKPSVATASCNGPVMGFGLSASMGTSTSKLGRSEVRPKVDATTAAPIKKVRTVSEPKVDAGVVAVAKKAGKKLVSATVALPKAQATSESASTHPPPPSTSKEDSPTSI